MEEASRRSELYDVFKMNILNDLLDSLTMDRRFYSIGWRTLDGGMQLALRVSLDPRWGKANGDDKVRGVGRLHDRRRELAEFVRSDRPVGSQHRCGGHHC